MLVRTFRAQKDQAKTVHTDWLGVGRTYSQLADEIEAMSDVGKAVVAATGLVLAAMSATPERFANRKMLA